MGCLSLLLCWLAIGCSAGLPFCYRRWAGTRLRCVAASHRRFGRCEPAVEPFCQVVRCAIRRSWAATGGEKRIPQACGGLESAPRSPREGICLQPSAKLLPQSAGVERPQRLAFLLSKVTGVPRVAVGIGRSDSGSCSRCAALQIAVSTRLPQKAQNQQHADGASRVKRSNHDAPLLRLRARARPAVPQPHAAHRRALRPDARDQVDAAVWRPARRVGRPEAKAPGLDALLAQVQV